MNCVYLFLHKMFFCVDDVTAKSTWSSPNTLHSLCFCVDDVTAESTWSSPNTLHSLCFLLCRLRFFVVAYRFPTRLQCDAFPSLVNIPGFSVKYLLLSFSTNLYDTFGMTIAINYTIQHVHDETYSTAEYKLEKPIVKLRITSTRRMASREYFQGREQF